MRTRAQAEKAIGRAVAELDRRVMEIAESVRRDRVIPACKRAGATFSSGMGTFAFFKGGHPMDDEHPAIREVIEILNLEIYHANYLGFWVRDVDASDLERQ